MNKILYVLKCIIVTLVSFTIGHITNLLLLIIGIILWILGLKPIVIFLVPLWANHFFWLMGKRIKYIGLDNIEKDKNYIVVGNHSSIYDIPAVMTIFPKISWVAKDKLFNVPFLGWFIRMYGCIGINRSGIKEAKESLDKAINKGKTTNFNIGIFPEGTRTLDGNLHKFKRGFIQIFRNTKFDIIPLTLNGFYKLKPKNRFHIDPNTNLEIIIHEPISYNEFANKTDNEIIEYVKNIIEKDYKH